MGPKNTSLGCSKGKAKHGVRIGLFNQSSSLLSLKRKYAFMLKEYSFSFFLYDQRPLLVSLPFSQTLVLHLSIHLYPYPIITLVLACIIDSLLTCSFSLALSLSPSFVRVSSYKLNMVGLSWTKLPKETAATNPFFIGFEIHRTLVQIKVIYFFLF